MNTTDDTFTIVLTIIGGCVVLAFNAWLGSAIGSYRGRKDEGFWFGLCLGPIGWIITALLPESGPKCPHCLGVVPVGATRCKHCAAEIEKVQPESQPTDRVWYIARGEKVEGPFTPVQIMLLLRAGKLTATDLCAKEGAQEWRPIRDVI